VSCFIGIDPSMTGFAAVAIGAPVTSTLRIVPEFRGVRRLAEIREQFTRWLSALPSPEHVCLEGYANGAKYNREMMGEVGAVTRLVLHDVLGNMNVSAFPTLVQPLQVKQFAGDTKAKKDDLKLLVYKKWGVEFQDHNVVDAYILARMAEAIETTCEFEYERTVLAKLTLNTEAQMIPQRGKKAITPPARGRPATQSS
jgi:crossover junction endodeoxyribonuclease RuvC